VVGFLRGGRRTSVVVEDHHAACDEAAVCYRGRCGCLGGGDDSWLRVLCQHACRGASREQESGQRRENRNVISNFEEQKRWHRYLMAPSAVGTFLV
jgi:hypothetical protein